MEVKMILTFAVIVLFSIALSRGQGTAPRDGGPNICHTLVTETVSETVTYNEPYTYRTTTWCWVFWSCTQYFIKYRLGQRVEQKTIYKMINKCCAGYRNVNGICLAQCENDCNGHGSCVAPGVCKCSPGFTGNYCESICAEGTWGQNCDRRCNCNGHGTCSTMDGRDICAAGYTGENCQTTRHNSFGVNCQIQCACQNGATCDHVTGTCHCAPGFYGPLCHLTCPPGTHGDNCQNMCLCQNGGQCHHVSGICDCSKVFGYMGTTDHRQKWVTVTNFYALATLVFGLCRSRAAVKTNANRVTMVKTQMHCPCLNGGSCYQTTAGGDIACNCSAGFIGKFCNQTCPCANGARCYYTNTGIIGCDCPVGFIGDKCNIRACAPDKYGANCEYNCQCIQNSTELCHPNTGHCFCKPGWQGIYCNQPCSFPYYGENCAKVCDCLNNGDCNHITGQCECQPGFKGVRCGERCDEGTFGVKCQEKCYCKNGASCNASNGHCICTHGWNGTFCESPCVGYYGLNCNSLCLCQSETSVCDPFDGSCTCKSGYTGKYCTEQCSAWRFGSQCSQLCSSFCDQTNSLGCHHVTGECICKPGWNECPEFTTITANTTFITTSNIAELVPNVFNRSVGTKVTLSCFETYKLVGNKYIECLSTGRWNTTMPKCLPGTSGTGSSSSNVSSRSSGIFGGDNQMTILTIIVIIVAVIALIILLIFCCCLIWRTGRRRYKNKTKIDQLDTNRPQSHSEYHKRINGEGYPYVTNGLYNYVWHDSSHYPDLIRYHDNNDDNISTIVRQPYFKIPRPAYIN